MKLSIEHCALKSPAIGRTFLSALLALSFALVAPSALAEDIEVSVQTIECSGEVGFSSFPVGRLVKISEGWCSDPSNSGQKLQQVFLKSVSGFGKYDLLWVTQGEAQSIMAQVKEIRDAKLKGLTRPDVVVERETVIREKPTPPPVNRSATQGKAAKPSIQIIDPPIGNVRSATNFMTSGGADSRMVVGRIEAPAGLLSLSVNGQPTETDTHGLFRTEVSLVTAETPVTIVAVDESGQSSTVEIRFLTNIPDSGPVTGDVDFFGHYYALVIANNAYAYLDDLRTPINDAETIASILSSKYGFHVTKLYDANRYDIVTALNKLRRELTERDNLLIYYAGHGELDRVNNRGHWLPVDAERDSTANWVATSVITDTLNAMSTKHVLVVADSCYSGSLARSAITELDPGMSDDARMKWLRTIAATRSRFVLTSGGIKPVLDDGGNGHSVFANAFITVLQDSKDILEGATLYRRVRDLVEARAQELNVDQTPQYSALKATGHEFGEFLLVSRR